MGRLTAHPTPPFTHALHDSNVNVVDGDVAKGVHDGLPTEVAIEPKPVLPLGCRWRVPLTQVHNPSGVLIY